MRGSRWRTPARADRGRLSEARLAAHYAAQWLARAARAFIAPEPDDRHSNLGWDDDLGGLTTHPLPDGSRLGLRLGDLTLLSVTLRGDVQSFSLDGKTDADARAWLGKHVSARGLDAHKLDAPSPYEMPTFGIAAGARYGADGDGLGALATWYANANSLLGETRSNLAMRNLEAPAVRCWPHHFDLDSLVYFPAKGADAVRTMGVGFSPGDEYYDEPYFYVSVYPAPAARPLLPAGAHWHTHHFTAAVATASELSMLADQRQAAEDYLAAATAFAIREPGETGQAPSLTSSTAR